MVHLAFNLGMWSLLASIAFIFWDDGINWPFVAGWVLGVIWAFGDDALADRGERHGD